MFRLLNHFLSKSLKPSFLKKILGLKVGDELNEIGSKIFKENYELSKNLKIELEKAKTFKLGVDEVVKDQAGNIIAEGPKTTAEAALHCDIALNNFLEKYDLENE